MRQRRKFAQLFALLLGLVSSLSYGETSAVLRLATTTSTENSGLLQVLLPPFESRTGIQVQVIAVGTGKALRMGRDGDVDVVLVHAPQAEQMFVTEGYGVNRRAVMYNDFVIVGPTEDPARIFGSKEATQALARIAASQETFVSRGDDSGTHRKELSLWQAVDIEPRGAWYREVGQGMGRVLQITDELDAYTLTDRGTWLAQRARLRGRILIQGDARLHNPYGIIAVNPARFPDIGYREAMQLIAWVTSPEGQSIIRDFRIGQAPLFHPLAVAN